MLSTAYTVISDKSMACLHPTFVIIWFADKTVMYSCYCPQIKTHFSCLKDNREEHAAGLTEFTA